MKIDISKETKDAMDAARKVHPWHEEMSEDELIFTIFLEWMKYQGQESLNDWISSFF